MKGKNNNIHGILKLSIILSIIICSVIFSANAASAADTGWVAPSSDVGGSGVSNPTYAYADGMLSRT